MRQGRAFPFLILISLLASSAAAGMSPPLNVRLYDEAIIDTQDVYLGQIAALEGADAGLRQALATVVIVASPAPGETRIVDAAFIQARLGQQGTIPAAWQLAGADRVRVTRGQQTVSAAQIQQLAADHVLARLPYPRKDVVVREVSVAGDVILPRGRLGVDVRPAGKSDYIGNVPLAVELAVDGQPMRRLLVTVRTEVMVPVVLARRPMARYHVITPEDVTVGRMDLVRVPADRLLDPNALVGQRAGRMIPAQTVLTAQMVETPPLVRRGDRVMIVAEGGGLRVSALGEVRHPGGRGEFVDVVNIDSRRKILARVVDSQTVAVDF